MNRTTIERQIQAANDRPRPRAWLAGAVIALTLPAAALGAVAQRTLVNSRPAPGATAPTTTASAQQDPGLTNAAGARTPTPARCEATYRNTKIMTMPYLYPDPHCRVRSMLV